MAQATRLTNLQMELLKLFAREAQESELLEIKRMLADYFARKMTARTNNVWQEQGLTDEKMDIWLKELS